MMSPADLLERLVHGNGEATADVHTETPKEVLDALEWSDADRERTSSSAPTG
jgi:hypothetical protein